MDDNFRAVTHTRRAAACIGGKRRLGEHSSDARWSMMFREMSHCCFASCSGIIGSSMKPSNSNGGSR